jgi:hypothetical protein
MMLYNGACSCRKREFSRRLRCVGSCGMLGNQGGSRISWEYLEVSRRAYDCLGVFKRL